MKLLYQLNAAFTALLIIIMSVTGFFMYSLIMDVLVTNEQKDLRVKGEFLLNVMYQEDYSARGPQLGRVIESNDLRVLVMDPDENQIMFSSLPPKTSRIWAKQFEDESEQKDLWKTDGNTYVVSKLRYDYRGERYLLALATPLEELQAIQSLYTMRLVAIFIIGIMVAVLFSYFLTKRLVTPLSRLKEEVNKIENRRFNEIQPVHATGEIGEVEQSVLDMAEELERYIHSQKHFFQNASHELKTPLMTIQGYAEGVKDGIFEGEKADRSLDLIVKESERLKKIVNEIILLAKLDSEEGIYHPENISIEKLLKETKERLHPLAAEKNVQIKIEVEEERELFVDEGKMLQALINIVSNGIRHAHHTVWLQSFERDGDVVLQIRDDGEGVPEDLLPQLFHRFVKGNEGETGLGLAISRAIIERSKGSIHVYNHQEGGAVFEIVM
ncbi:sensor histidine kinase [Pontibacillus marinus]|uniref:histidine kinase n=1 Tax=Pontibacillus marinus BH030004 = DSM 16465 TaxID=1385511 RepID=A0A0A5FZ49_9BACI|nr:HAMP domain-containing sensor histidine kinase [Pontibacillus marinus]KGX84113.1 histidine kinase [Pontibacillus marinus BH030004 = DSM 16465]